MSSISNNLYHLKKFLSLLIANKGYQNAYSFIEEIDYDIFDDEDK